MAAEVLPYVPGRLGRPQQDQDRLRDPAHPPLLQVRATPAAGGDRRRDQGARGVRFRGLLSEVTAVSFVAVGLAGITTHHARKFDRISAARTMMLPGSLCTERGAAPVSSGQARSGRSARWASHACSEMYASSERSTPMIGSSNPGDLALRRCEDCGRQRCCPAFRPSHRPRTRSSVRLSAGDVRFLATSEAVDCVGCAGRRPRTSSFDQLGEDLAALPVPPRAHAGGDRRLPRSGDGPDRRLMAAKRRLVNLLEERSAGDCETFRRGGRQHELATPHVRCDVWPPGSNARFIAECHSGMP